MFNLKHSLIQPGFFTYSLSAVFLGLVSMTPIQAKTPSKSQIVAQLPPGYASQRYNPEADFVSPFSSNNQNFGNYSSNYASYLVIVDNLYSGYLQQVRSVASDAFIPPQKPSVIQVGKFNRLDNAQQMAQELQRRGFNPRIESQNPVAEIPKFPNDPNYRNYPTPPRDNNQRKKHYYVAIPGRSKKLSQIENKIRQSAVGSSLYYQRRKSPRGHHIAVGPFSERLEAEQWNYYLRSLGLSNARVYYGK
ncbi:sporulation related protein [Rivularia sp. PCC 7116]|uniref:SPOR domain-containing protein n=1 Tax=Rivularia sp. PCC 7116 TaxID=373994 RepID=UPI00029F21D9|nr:SPOR domain-containing protein [Rivularia sp. PCC 7116]AFY53571.1 sporulation related protein [Rivularia sp. PCC 7116]